MGKEEEGLQLAVFYSLGETAKTANRITRAERSLGGHQSQCLHFREEGAAQRRKRGVLEVAVWGRGSRTILALLMFNPLHFSLYPALKDRPDIG